MTRPAPSRTITARRNALSEQEIVATALEIIKRAGVEGLTMRMLSDSLGVALGATYKHVPNKDELLRLVAHELYSRIHPIGQQVRDPLDSVRALLIRFEIVYLPHVLARASEARGMLTTPTEKVRAGPQ